MNRNFRLFDTALGPAGIAWGDRGVIGVQLPEPDPAQTRARLRRRFADALETAPPPEIQMAIEHITALLDGQPSDLSTISLDMDHVPTFERRVYEVARAVAPGETIT